MAVCLVGSIKIEQLQPKGPTGNVSIIMVTIALSHGTSRVNGLYGQNPKMDVGLGTGANAGADSEASGAALESAGGIADALVDGFGNALPSFWRSNGACALA